MDWIEIWFGVSPDKGDGSLEWLIVMAAFVIGTLAVTGAVAWQRSTILRIASFTGWRQAPPSGPLKASPKGCAAPGHAARRTAPPQGGPRQGLAREPPSRT